MADYFIIPKTQNVLALLPEESKPLLIYAVLYADSLTEDDYDGLTNEDGLKLFITPGTDYLESETGYPATDIPSMLEKLKEHKLIRIAKQSKGKPSVIFVEPTGINSAAQTPDAEPECPQEASELHTEENTTKYSEGETEIFECWQEVFGADPSPVIKEALSSYTGKMDAAVMMLAIYDSEGNAESVIPKLNDFINSGKKSMEDFKKVDADTSNPEPQPVTAEAKEEPETAPIPLTRIGALRAACDNEFSAPDVNELWVTMQNVIDEDKWNDYNYLASWLKEKYTEMNACLNGGERFVRIDKLQELISKG